MFSNPETMIVFVIGLKLIGSLVFGMFISLVVISVINYIVDEALFIEISNKALGYTFIGLVILITYTVFQYAI